MKKRVVCGKEAVAKRVQKMLDLRAYYEANLENAHINFLPGNDKTGKTVWQVSLIPIADCVNCSGCSGDCYDIQHVCWRPDVQRCRAENSALHRKDRERFWREVSEAIREKGIETLRLNIGGDLDDEDFPYIRWVASENPGCDILFFTKNYSGINSDIDERGDFPKNVKPVMSAWPDMPMENPHNLPVSHVLWEDGSTTAPEFGAVYCGGNCAECHKSGEGCWTLGAGGHVIFHAH